MSQHNCFYLFCSVLKCGTKATTMAEGVDLNQMPDKELQEKEKEPIKQMQPILKEFLDGRNDLQVYSNFCVCLSARLKSYCCWYFTTFEFHSV